MDKQGWITFQEVLAGDDSKLQLALSQLEQAANAVPADIHNLYTLGRAYFYDAVTHNRSTSADKAERILAKLLKLDPTHEGLAFHGSVLTFLSQGKDREKLREGIEELNRAVDRNPDNLTGRLSRAFTALSLPAEVQPAMGSYDPVEDLRVASQAFEGIEFNYAPHAEVVAKAFVGEGYLRRGDSVRAKTAFKAALAVQLPSEPGVREARLVVRNAIRKRMNGSEQNLVALFQEEGLGLCNTCHLRLSEKSKTSFQETPVAVPRPTPVKYANAEPATAGVELLVKVVGLMSAEGQVRLALYASEKDFLRTPFKSGTAAIEGHGCEWSFKGVPSGTYALAVYHDRNRNGELDKNAFSIPVEPYGFSNNARGMLGPPSFKDASFVVDGPRTNVEVRLK